jgi:hypothetical protein
MAMKCWICSRQAKGYGHVDIRYRIGHPRRYPIDWVFCSRRCQACFHKLYVQGVKALESDHGPAEGDVIDATEAEISAMHRCLKPMGEAANAIGINKPLGHYSQDEALRLIGAVITTYVEVMAQEHERTKYPPVRMNLAPAVDRPTTGLTTPG